MHACIYAPFPFYIYDVFINSQEILLSARAMVPTMFRKLPDNEANEVCKTYFDKLPIDAVFNVVRFLSRTPGLPDWNSRLDVSAVLLLNNLHGQILAVAVKFHGTPCIHRFRPNGVHNYGRKNMMLTDSLESLKYLLPYTGTQYSALDIRTDFGNEPNIAKFVILFLL